MIRIISILNYHKLILFSSSHKWDLILERYLVLHNYENLVLIYIMHYKLFRF